MLNVLDSLDLIIARRILQSPFSSGGSKADLINNHRGGRHRSLPAGLVVWTV
jgi:hypothetical protein